MSLFLSACPGFGQLIEFSLVGYPQYSHKYGYVIRVIGNGDLDEFQSGLYGPLLDGDLPRDPTLLYEYGYV